MSQRRHRAEHTRTVQVEGHGVVRVFGRAVWQYRLLYPDAVGEATRSEIFAQLASGDEVPEQFWLHPATLREIVGQSDLEVDEVERLSGVDRARVIAAIYQAHPETRRLLPQSGGVVDL